MRPWIFFLPLHVLAADPAAADRNAPPTVLEVRIEGNTRTRDETIRNEMLTRTGLPFSQAQWEADVQRVEDTGLFWRVRSKVDPRAEGVRLSLEVEEKWTLLGILDFTHTDDVLVWRVGAYEANLLGRNQELGFEISRKRAGYGFRTWHMIPRIGRSPYFSRIDASRMHRPHAVYPATVGDDSPSGFYEAQRTRLRLEGGRRLNPEDTVRLSLSYQPVRTRFSLLSVREGETLEAPVDRLLHWVGSHLRWGRIHRDREVFHGRSLSLNLSRAIPAPGTDIGGFTHASAGARWFFRPLPRHNAGIRLRLGAVQRRAFEDAFTLGGLSEVRGFPDERFRGQYLWTSNAEYRYPLVDTRHIFAQAAAFGDAGRVWDGPSGFGGAFDETAFSAGAGVRLSLRQFYSTMLRLDYAATLHPYRTQGLNVGVAQFF